MCQTNRILQNRYNFPYGEVYLLFRMGKNEFDKMQIPLCPYSYTRFAKDWFGDYRSLRFCAPASVGALFYFILFFRRKK
jgi:hypothetical protein